MNTFDYIAEARTIQDALGDDHSDWRSRINEAIVSGSTGTEILMAIRWNFTELLKAEPPLSIELASRVRDYIAKANKLLK